MRLTMTIGEVLAKLNSFRRDKPVRYGFCNLSPTGVMSYRGYYNEAAIGYDEDKRITCQALIDNLNQAVDGRTFTGYKGGEYAYTLDTPLHVDNYGHCTGTKIKSVKELEYVIVINTFLSED